MSINRLFILAITVVNLAAACSNSSLSSNNVKSKNEPSINEAANSSKTVITQRITPTIWIETKDAKAAVDYYLSIFKTKT